MGNALGEPYQEAFVASELNGRWGPAVEVPAIARLNAGGLAQSLTISWVSVGDCAVGGSYQDRAGDTSRSSRTRSAVRGARRCRCRAQAARAAAG